MTAHHKLTVRTSVGSLYSAALQREPGEDRPQNPGVVTTACSGNYGAVLICMMVGVEGEAYAITRDSTIAQLVFVTMH